MWRRELSEAASWEKRIIFFEMGLYEIAGQARNDVVGQARNDVVGQARNDVGGQVRNDEKKWIGLKNGKDCFFR